MTTRFGASVLLTAVGLASSVSAQSSGFGINCAIRPLQVVEIAAPTSGIVSEVFVRPGSTVAKGDLIATFDADLINAQLAAAEVRATLTAGRDAAQAQRDALAVRVNRLRQGVARRAVSQSDLEAARLELATAQGALSRETDLLVLAELEAEEARIALTKTEVRSPVAGAIGEDLIDVGESPQGRHVAIVYVNDPLRVEAYVPTPLLADFLGRDAFEIVVNQQTTVPVTLDYVAQVADLSSNTQSVYFTLDADNILPGYQCLFPSDGN
ncbi:biotin/lipoyl-binding protein [Octadecabacter sp. G9-8]|uniref:Biotin/lipoyl-binding protein n=1 Tax=Octadecabacter dasysiphoniae TaxID=2909341 RepID=A0ABS9CYL2_9RHOB|nr:biotin/lipoyl-binding protein [Octadecabacter dasysiphoniae]MCF2872361.1 biotin/lipoyl-binding protein [Octadecabacter dasysiphoniae]